MGNLHPVKCCGKSVWEEEDRLSQLPSCVFSHILSLAFPTMKHAARTSVLSRFWRHRWLFDFDEFNFDFYRWVEDEGKEPLVTETIKYVKWITNVLHSHQVATLETDDDDKTLLIKKLRIDLPLSVNQKDVDKWISYAFARRVESLELRLLLEDHPQMHRLVPPNESYCCHFPDQLVESKLDCLRSLSLEGLRVTGEDIKSFLFKFRFLEYLKVSCAPALENVEVCGSSLALKHLWIGGSVYSASALSVTVCNTRLISLHVTWTINKLVLVNNPNLVVVYARCWTYPPPDERILKQLSGCFSTLKVLNLGTVYFYDAEVVDGVPQLGRLKQLTLVFDPLREVTLTCLTALLSLSPMLEKLTLEFVKYDLKGGMAANYVTGGPSFLLQHLETVEVRSYREAEAEDEFLRFFFTHLLVPLKKVIFDRRDNFFKKFVDEEGEKSDGALAKVRRLIPSSAVSIVM